MSGYSWVSGISILCYLFLLLSFLSTRKIKGVIRSFVVLLVIMLLWTGGSVGMRLQLWPAVNFWQELAQRVTVCAVLPRIIRDDRWPVVQHQLAQLRKLGVGEALIGNLGHLLPAHKAGMKLRGDVSLNLYNSASVNAARELKMESAALSFEMTMPQIRDVSKAVPCELLIYGRLPLMVTENCLIKGRTGSCTCKQGPAKLTDKTGAEFPIIKDGDSCRSILLNGKKLYWLDRQDDLGRLGLWATRLYFTTENAKEVDQILSYVHEPAPFNPGANTRGLYLRGLE